MELTEVLVTSSTRQSTSKAPISPWTIQLPLDCAGLAGHRRFYNTALRLARV